jgi:flagellar biosynthesis protein FlhG
MDQAEGLRNIIKKQNNSNMGDSHTAKVVTVTSGKGGVGKSSVSVNLAIELSRMGKRVVIMDADFGLANIEVMLGIRPEYNLADMMFRGKSLQDIIFYGPMNIGFISGGSGIHEMANMTKDQIYVLVHRLYELDMMADYIIIDTGAGISDSVMEFVAASEEVLLVITPEPTSITDAYALLKSLGRHTEYARDKTIIKMIANQIKNQKDSRELFDKLSVVVNKFLNIDVEFFGSVPYDNNMHKAVMKQMPITLENPGSPAAIALATIAGKLTDIEWKDTGKLGIMQMFSKVLRMKFSKT